jgi:hypothetical protein
MGAARASPRDKSLSAAPVQRSGLRTGSKRACQKERSIRMTKGRKTDNPTKNSLLEIDPKATNTFCYEIIQSIF